MEANKTDKVKVQNVNHSEHVRYVDADMYAAMRLTYLKVLPTSSPGITLAEVQERLLSQLPKNLFPNGARAGWWAKTVQLDLEAKGLVSREKTKPLRLHKVQ